MFKRNPCGTSARGSASPAGEAEAKKPPLDACRSFRGDPNASWAVGGSLIFLGGVTACGSTLFKNAFSVVNARGRICWRRDVMSETCVPVRLGQRGGARSPPFRPLLGDPRPEQVLAPHAADFCRVVRLTAFVVNRNHGFISISLSSCPPPGRRTPGQQAAALVPRSVARGGPSAAASEEETRENLISRNVRFAVLPRLGVRCEW